jgi:hypothetical protein
MSQTRIRPTRTDLYEKVWATAMRILAKEFGRSDVGLAKVCRKHNVPVPPVGYWRRKETGYKVTRPLLPVAKDAAEHLDICVRERLRPEFKELTGQVATKVIVTPEISHPLALRSQRLLERGKTNQRGLLPSKNGALAHIFVSGEQVPRALKSSTHRFNGLHVGLFSVASIGFLCAFPPKDALGAFSPGSILGGFPPKAFGYPGSKD